MKEYPILFNGEMVRAILDGRKTMTRRVLKPQPEPCGDGILRPLITECPYGYIGDKLWVRETFVHYKNFKIPEMKHVTFPDGGQAFRTGLPYIPSLENRPVNPEWFKSKAYKVHPSIHMPRWASRITLEITSVRVERLQEIMAPDCIYEGVVKTLTEENNPKPRNGHLIKRMFRDLWDSMNQKHPWESNPWVWVIKFKKVTP